MQQQILLTVLPLGDFPSILAHSKNYTADNIPCKAKTPSPDSILSCYIGACVAVWCIYMHAVKAQNTLYMYALLTQNIHNFSITRTTTIVDPHLVFDKGLLCVNIASEVHTYCDSHWLAAHYRETYTPMPSVVLSSLLIPPNAQLLSYTLM